MSEETSTNVIPLIGVSYALTLYSISLVVISFLIYRNYSALARPLAICMVDWVLTSLSVIPFMVYILSQWRGQETELNMTVLWYVGVNYFCTVSPVSFSVFCLTIDRILSLVVPLHYGLERRKALCAFNVCAQVVIFITVFLLERGHMAPEGTYKSCLAVGCVTAQSGVYISQVKLGVGVLNTAAALIFAIIFAKFSKRRAVPLRDGSKRSQRQANFLAAVAVLMEFCFNCVPNVAGLVFQTIYGVLPSGDLGPYLSYFLATETFCIAMLYAKILGNPLVKRQSSRILVTKCSKDLHTANRSMAGTHTSIVKVVK